MTGLDTAHSRPGAPHASTELQRARAEVRARGADLTRFTSEQMAGRDYLEACAHETMRLKPVGPVQVIEALRDTVIAGVHVPAGTGVSCVICGDSVDARLFPNPEAFVPRRWINEHQANEGYSASLAKRVSMSIGGGLRACRGRYLALREIKTPMTMLLTPFDITDGTGRAAHHLAPARLTRATTPQRSSAASACAESAIRSSIASKPSEKRTSVPRHAGCLRIIDRS